MDKEKTYKETPKQTKSASGIWDWILCVLFLVLPVAVFVAYGKYIYYAFPSLPGPPAPEVVVTAQVPKEEWYCSLCDKKFEKRHQCYFCEFHKDRHIVYYRNFDKHSGRLERYEWKISDVCTVICSRCEADFTSDIEFCPAGICDKPGRFCAEDFSKCDRCLKNNSW